MKIKEATQLTGKSRTAILRAIQDGKFSAKKDASGVWDIDPAELSRVYDITLPDDEGGVRRAHVRAHPNGAHRTGGGAQGDTPEIATENAMLRVQLDAAQEMVEERGKTIEHLRSELAEERDERREAQTKLTALLSDMRPESSQEAQKGPLVRLGFWVALAAVAALVVAAMAYLGAWPA